MARAILANDDDEYDESGFMDEEGNVNIIDDVTLDSHGEDNYRSNLSKSSSGKDQFNSIPVSSLDRNGKRRAKRLAKAFTGMEGARSKQVELEQINGYALYDLAHPPYNLDSLVKLSVENDTHYACIKVKALNIVGIGYKWSETTKVKEARQDVEEDDDKMLKLSKKLQRVTGTLDEWLEDMNEEDDFNEILIKVWLDVEATGNGYLEIGRNRNGGIAYLGHIPSATMRVRKYRDGFIQLVQDKLTFFRNFNDKTTADPFGKDPTPNEVIHFKLHSTVNAYYGVPDIIAAMSSVAGEKFSSEYNLDYFENKAVPRYALIVKGAKLSTNAERKILEFFRKEVKGRNHGTLYIPVPAHMGSNVDVKLEAIENKAQEASFEKYREGNRSSIAMVHGVHLSMLGVSKGVAAAREEAKAFKVQRCGPFQRAVSHKLNRLIRTKTDLYKLELEASDLIDEETRSRIHDRYVRTGVEGPNEARSDLGMHPRKGGDKFIDLAEESIAKARFVHAQADKVIEDTRLAEKSIAVKTATPTGSGGGTSGPARTTTDGSDKNKQQTSTPKSQTSAGTGTKGTAQDKGKEKSTRRV